MRDSGRALGVDLGIIEKVCKSHRWFDSKADLLNRLMESGLDPEAPLSRQPSDSDACPIARGPGTLAVVGNGRAAAIANILTRMKDLATQSADGSSSTADQTAMQSEYDSLTDELSNIFSNTKFGGAAESGSFKYE